MDLKLDLQTGDLAVENGQIPLVTGADAVVQRLLIRLRSVQGEWFLDQRIGFPHYEAVLVKNPDLDLVRSLLRRAILEAPGVATLDVLELDYDAAGRELSVSGEGTIDDGSPFTFTELIL